MWKGVLCGGAVVCGDSMWWCNGAVVVCCGVCGCDVVWVVWKGVWCGGVCVWCGMVVCRGDGVFCAVVLL